MTNGEKIVQLFPDAQVDQGETRIYVWLDHSSTTFDREWWNAEYKESSKSKIPTGSTTKNNLGVDCISRDEVCRYVAEFVNHEFSTREEEELIDNIITGIECMPPVTPQEPRKGYLSIDDVMSVFDDFMCGEVDEDGTETFLEMLKDKAEIEPQDNEKLIERIDKIKNDMADIGEELRTRFDKYKTEIESQESEG